MKVGKATIKDSDYARLVLSLLASLQADVNTMRGFVQLNLSETNQPDLPKIQQTYLDRYKSHWNDLQTNLYRIYGNLDLEDLTKRDGLN